MTPVSLDSEHVCKNCGYVFKGRYCNACGEKVYTEQDRSVLHFFAEGFHFITHLEGTLFTTMRTIFTHPGVMALEFCDGRRKRYFKPLSLFLLLVVIYLLAPGFSGLNQKLYFYFNHGLYGDFARHQTAIVMAKTHYTYHQVNQKFHEIAEKYSRFLLLVLIPFSALVLWPLTFRRRPFYFDQAVLATEINCFFLIWAFMIMRLLIDLADWLLRLVSSYEIPDSDLAVALPAGIVWAIYLGFAFRKFYAIKYVWAVLLGIVFLLIHQIFIINTIYKFLLFVTVIYQIH